MALPNYVKFQRGSLASYNRLSHKDEDTLYFIYNPDDESRGSLYLGNRLIGEVGGSGGVNNLSELSDILITAAQAGDFLVLNSEGKWINVSAAEVASNILEAGGNFVSIDENEFQFNSVNGNLELKGYTNATVGMIPIKTNSGLGWQSAPVDLSAKVGSLETNLTQAQTDIASIQSDLSSVDGKISDAIRTANHLQYKIIDNVSEATDTNTIYLIANNTSDSSNQYNEYMFINGALELLGQMSVDLSNYMTSTEVLNALANKADNSTVTALDTRVGSLENSVSSLNSTVSNLNTTVSNLSSSVSTLETRVGTLENNIGDYVLTTTFQSVVGDLSTINGVYNDLDTDASIADNLTEIYERLTWQEINE